MGRTAEDFALPDLKGNTVSLEALRKEGPVVVVFLRGWVGYQCPFCTQQVGTLIGRSGEFKEAHTRIVLIYPGPATEVDEKAKEFLAGKSLPETIFLATDAGLATVNAWNLRWDKKGETVYPSTFVVNTDGKVVFAKISHSHADRAATADVLKAIPKS